MKTIIAVTIWLSSSLVLANGLITGDSFAKKIADSLGEKTLVCVGGADYVTVKADGTNTLQMVAKYAGNISGVLDTNDEKDGEECGGLDVAFNSPHSDYVLDDSYDDCERGNWGYRLILSEDALRELQLGSSVSALGVPRVADSNNSKYRALNCKL